MKITYVGEIASSIASHRYRILLPSTYLARKQGWEIYNGDPEDNTDIAVFTKHFDYSALDKAHKFQGVRVFDVCDYHFNTKHADFYRSMISACDVITCSTEYMREQIKIQSDKDATVIPDPYEFVELAPEFAPEETPRLVWFGHESNIRALEKIPLRGKTTIVTNCEEKDSGPIKWVPYSKDAVIYHARESDLVLIPQILDNRGLSKGNNRLLESLRMGKFSICSDVPSYRELEEFCYIGDIKEGIEWAYANKQEVRDKIKAGQAYIRQRYSPESIGEMWRGVFAAAMVSHERIPA